MPLNASNLEKFPFFTPKGHHRVCWFIFIILQLLSTSIENFRVDTIDTINRIYCIDQYKDNQYDQYDRLTLYTSPT